MNENLAAEIISMSLKRNCDMAEVYIKDTKGLSVEAKDGKVEALEASKGFNIALRVVKNKKMGFSFVTSKEDIDSLVTDAVNGADWNTVDEYTDLPESGTSEEMDRRKKEADRDPAGWKPKRKREISSALKAYASMVSSADRGAIRLVKE